MNSFAALFKSIVFVVVPLSTVGLGFSSYFIFVCGKSVLLDIGHINCPKLVVKILQHNEEKYDIKCCSLTDLQDSFLFVRLEPQRVYMQTKLGNSTRKVGKS